MKEIQKKIQKFINASIVTSVAFIVLGILFMIFPEGFLNVLRWIIAVAAFATGIYMIAAEVSRRAVMPFFSTTALGAILIVIGLIFATHPGATSIFAVVLGAWFIVSALSSLRFSAALSGSSALVSTIFSILSLICGILLIMNPWAGSISVMTFIGIMMIIYAASSLIDMLILKGHLKDLSKKMKGLVVDIELDKKA